MYRRLDRDFRYKHTSSSKRAQIVQLMEIYIERFVKMPPKDCPWYSRSVAYSESSCSSWNMQSTSSSLRYAKIGKIERSQLHVEALIMTIMAMRRTRIYESTKSVRVSCMSTRILVKPISDTEVNRFPSADNDNLGKDDCGRRQRWCNNPASASSSSTRGQEKSHIWRLR